MGIREMLQSFFTKEKKTIRDTKETILPTYYDLNYLETRINEDTGKISIYIITSAKSVSAANTCVTIENIEDETDVRQYTFQHFRNIPVYNRVYNDDEQREKEREYSKKNKSNSLRSSLYSILGDYYDNTQRFSKKQLLKLKGQMEEHIHDPRYYGLYCITSKDGSKEQKPKLVASISRKYPEIEPIYEDGKHKGCKFKGDIVEELVSLDDKKHIGILHRTYSSPYSLIKSENNSFNVEELTQSMYNKQHDAFFYTEFAIIKIANKYRDDHSELFGQTVNDTESVGVFCERVPTPVVSSEFLGGKNNGDPSNNRVVEISEGTQGYPEEQGG